MVLPESVRFSYLSVIEEYGEDGVVERRGGRALAFQGIDLSKVCLFWWVGQE